MFKELLFTHRCLIPADGFYEWKDRQPYYFQTLNKQLFAFAGLWSEDRCVIITRAADQNMQGIHDRMPVIIPAGLWGGWLLVPKNGKPRNSIISLELPEKPEALTARPVSKRVNKVKFDDPTCLDAGEIQTSLFPDEE
jgi:putative SOS response-associated peptidase YedK